MSGADICSVTFSAPASEEFPVKRAWGFPEQLPGMLCFEEGRSGLGLVVRARFAGGARVGPEDREER